MPVAHPYQLPWGRAPFRPSAHLVLVLLSVPPPSSTCSSTSFSFFSARRTCLQAALAPLRGTNTVAQGHPLFQRVWVDKPTNWATHIWVSLACPL